MLSGKIMAAAAGRTTPTPPPVSDFESTRFTAARLQRMSKASALTGISNSSIGIVSFWFKPATINSEQWIFGAWPNNNQNFAIFYDSSSRINIQSAGSSTDKIRARTTVQITDTSKWVHVMIVWNFNAASGGRTANFYLNGVLAASSFVRDTGSAFSVPYTSLTSWVVGAFASDGTTFPLNSTISEVFFAPGQTLDLSIQANREKFALNGEPVDLGADGSTPTGTAPAIYLHHDYSSFGTNSGTGGDFTIVNGPLTDGGGEPFYVPYPATALNGTNQTLTRTNMTGVSDGTTGILSFWVRLGAAPSTTTSVLKTTDAGSNVHFSFISGGAMAFRLRDTATTSNFQCNTPSSTFTTSTWYHVLCAWDTNAAPASRTMKCYINGSAVSLTISSDTGAGALSINYNQPWGIGAFGTNYLNGSLAELYFAPNQYLDLDVQANREKFALAGKPVSLGSDGSTPTGSAPALYLHNDYSSFGTNSGAGGNFTINNGPLLDQPSRPSY